MKKDWHILKPDFDSVEKIQIALKCSYFLGVILANRNMVSLKELPGFINPALSDIRFPFSIKGMKRAVERIYQALKRHEKILIFGDYDVDGISATCIIFEFLQNAGGDATYYIPHRIKEGYGLRKKHIDDFAKTGKINLVITVDCGISSHRAVDAAEKRGIDVIITDHHHVPEKLPEAFAILNPKQKDCESGLDDLAGVGVAFYLLIGLRKYLRDMFFWDKNREPNLLELCDLVALGTASDQVPMLNENRILSRAGTKMISEGKRIGLKALMKISNIRNRHIDSDDILFRLAPRLNAAGRMSHAHFAVELLTENNPGKAEKIARHLSDLNMERKTVEDEIYADAMNFINKEPSRLEESVLVLFSEKWHEGIIGIVASRVAEKFCRPAILISTRSKIGKGSGRSVEGFDLYEALSACSGEIEDFGGHSMQGKFILEWFYYNIKCLSIILIKR